MSATACSDICTGDLNKKIDVFARNNAGTPDGQGGITASADVDKLTNIWASVKPRVLEEVFENGQVRGINIQEVVFRYSAAAAALDLNKLKVRFPSGGAREFEVLSAINLESANRYFFLKCKELPANG